MTAARRIATTGDIESAIAWAIGDLTPGEFSDLTSKLRPLKSDFNEARPEVVAALAVISTKGRRSPWTIACAVLAADAAARGDTDLHHRAAAEVLTAWRAASRATKTRSPLSRMLADLRSRRPALTFDDLARLIDSGDPAIAEAIAGADHAQDEVILADGRRVALESVERAWRRTQQSVSVTSP